MSRLLVFPLSTPSNGFKQFKQQPKQAAAEGTRRDDSPLREQGGPLVSSSACLLWIRQREGRAGMKEPLFKQESIFSR